jgi:hypothetical protein
MAGVSWRPARATLRRALEGEADVRKSDVKGAS